MVTPQMPTRTAVILNANAKRVTERRARHLQLLSGGHDVFVSHSMEEADALVQHVVARGYQRVLAGGGDGTVVNVINSICERAERSGMALPQFGILRMGTGNAVASLLGSASPEEDLLRLMQEPQLPVVPLGLIRNAEDGKDFPFAGIGYDGEILNDYVWLKQNVKGPLVDDVAHSVLGYFAALMMRTLPRKLAEKAPPNVTIRTHGRAFYRDPADNDAMREIPAGSVLYRGPAAMVSASTVPFYGYNFRMFPFAQDMPGMMQLRVVAMNPWKILSNLPAIWAGTHRDPECMDFHVEHVTVDGDCPLPFQVGGDAQGHRSRLEFAMSPRKVDLVSPRHLPLLAA
jgi:diacylglycerol kinase family enzyme